MSETPPLSNRVVDLELLVTHLQRDLDALNGAMIDQQKQIDALQRVIAGLNDRVKRLDDDEPRDPLDEKPPHY